MKEDDMEDFLDEEEGDNDIDEHELEVRAKVDRPINWRRVELLRERMYLREQLSDFDSYNID